VDGPLALERRQPPGRYGQLRTTCGVSKRVVDASPRFCCTGHACENCYTKALLLPRATAGVLAAHVAARFTAKPVDWLLAEVEKAPGGARLRALVPNLAEHVGDQSSLRGVRREWQRSAYFKRVPFRAAGESAGAALARAQDEAQAKQEAAAAARARMAATAAAAGDPRRAGAAGKARWTGEEAPWRAAAYAAAE
jgi:hypothetical protein